MKYINRLVAKKILPQELKAEYQTEDMSFKNFVDQIQEGAYGYEKQDPDIKDKEGIYLESISICFSRNCKLIYSS